jgi:hypothetical protein
MRFRQIEDQRGVWPVRVMCDALSVSPSGYYAWRSRPESPRKIADRGLLGDIQRVHARHRERYGAPRIHAELRAEGHTVSRKRIERVMRQHGIRARASRRYRGCTTDSKHSLPVAANLLDQNFVANRPNQVWLADITYIPTGEGWPYLAVILDLFTPSSGLRPGGRVLSRSRPSMPSCMNRSCQRHTTDLLRPVPRLMALVPSPSAVKQNDAGPPDMLLQAVSVRHHRLKPSTVGGCHIDDDPLAHAPDSHDACEPGILSGTHSSDCMH